MIHQEYEGTDKIGTSINRFDCYALGTICNPSTEFPLSPSLRSRVNSAEGLRAGLQSAICNCAMKEIIMQSSTEGAAPKPLFVQYMTFKADPACRRLPMSARSDGRESFAQAVEEYAPAITTWAYSTLGMKTGCELLLWRRGADLIAMQEMTSRLL